MRRKRREGDFHALQVASAKPFQKKKREALKKRKYRRKKHQGILEKNQRCSDAH